MCPIDSNPTPDDRYVCVIWLSRAGYVTGPEGRPIEAEPSPASIVTEVAEKDLTALLTGLRTALPGATLVEPLALLGETPEEIAPQITQRLNELVK